MVRLYVSLNWGLPENFTYWAPNQLEGFLLAIVEHRFRDRQCAYFYIAKVFQISSWQQVTE